MIRNKILPDMSPKRNTGDARRPDACTTTPAHEKILESRTLLGDGGEVLIHHEGRLYRLKRTRLGKLILTA